MAFSNGSNKGNSEMPAYLIFAEAHYKASMEKRLLSLLSLEDQVLEDYHQLALQKALQLVADAGSLTESVRQAVTTKLEALFAHYKETNEQKRRVRSPAIGIDLGTTYCCVAAIQNGKMRIIQNSTGEPKTPSYVAFHGSNENMIDDDTSELVVGIIAKKLSHVRPQTTIYDGKRMIGRQFDDPRLTNEKKLWPFEVKKNMPSGEILIKTGTTQWTTPEEIAAHLVKYIKQFSEEKLGSDILNAVVAVPAYFNNRQRELTKEACRLAGLNVLQLINEPTAGAVAYNMHNLETENGEKSKNCLIFDLGGGTFDVAVLTMKKSHIHIKAVGGDSHLGGEDFDNNMVDYCLEEFKRQHGIDIISLNNSVQPPETRVKISVLLRRLKRECEAQKEILTKLPKAPIAVDALYEGQNLYANFTRAKFEELNLHLFQKCIDIVETVVKDAGMMIKDIDDVVLVGGSSRIPKVKEMLSNLFGGKNLCKEIEPDEAVAVGAATLAFYAQNPEVPNLSIREPEFQAEPTEALPTTAYNSKGEVNDAQTSPKNGKATNSTSDTSRCREDQNYRVQGTSDRRELRPTEIPDAVSQPQPKTSPNNEDEVTISEYLTRKVRCLTGAPVFGAAAREKSFFVALRGSKMYLWRAESGTHSSEEQAAVIDIRGATCAAKECLDAVVRSFTVKLPDKSEYQFIAPDNTLTQSWVSQINRHAGVRRAQTFREEAPHRWRNVRGVQDRQARAQSELLPPFLTTDLPS